MQLKNKIFIFLVKNWYLAVLFPIIVVLVVLGTIYKVIDPDVGLYTLAVFNLIAPVCYMVLKTRVLISKESKNKKEEGMKKYLVLWWETFKYSLPRLEVSCLVASPLMFGGLKLMGHPLELKTWVLATTETLLIAVPLITAVLSLVLVIAKAITDLIEGEDVLPI